MLRYNQKILIKKQKIANTFVARALGLMFSKKSNFDYALIFDLERNTIIGACIHMFFVFYKINVLFLDSSKEIVDIKKNVKPFTPFCCPKKKSRYIIELPPNININNLNVGTKLSWD